MLTVVIAGAAHDHVQYAVDEFSRQPDIRLVAVSDPSPELAQRYAAPFGAAVYNDHGPMFADLRPDVVVVAGIYGDRARVVIDALQSGSEVVADKPLCTTLEQLDAIAAAAESSGRSVSLLLEKRYYAETLAIKGVIEANELGPIVGVSASGPHKLNRSSRPAWYFRRSSYGGLLNDLAVHDIDLALALTGATQGTICARQTFPLEGAPAFAQYATATLTTPGAIIELEVNWLTPAGSAVHGDYQMRLVGARGVAELLWARGKAVVTTEYAGPRELDLSLPRRPAEPVFTALRHGDKLDITTHDSLLATRLGLLAQLSAENSSRTFSWTA